MSTVLADPNVRPTALAVDEMQLPVEIRRVGRRFVSWQWTWKGGKWTKPPLYVNGSVRNASVTDESTWVDFDEAVSTYRRRPDVVDGIGLVLTGDDFFGVDLDDCRDPDSGALTADAAQLVSRAKTYTEVSPSGRGLRLLFFGLIPADLPARKRGSVEMYDRGRYLTLTGHRIEGTPEACRQLTSLAVTQLHEVLFGAPVTVEPQRRHGAERKIPHNLDDVELIAQIRASHQAELFARLFDAGDITSYGSASEADLGLASLLMWWTGGDLDQADRLFRASALMRDKWDSPRRDSTYGRETLCKATPVDGGYRPPSNSLAGRTDRHAAGGEATPAAATSTTRRKGITAEERSDLGVARRFAAEYGHLYRYSEQLAQWFHWDECRLGAVGESVVIADLHCTTDAMVLEAATTRADAKTLTWVVAVQNAPRIRAALDSARTSKASA